MFGSILISNNIQNNFVFKYFLNVLSLNWEKDVQNKVKIENIEEVFEDLIDENIVKSDDVEDAAEYGIEKIDVVVENAVKKLRKHLKTGFMRILSTLLASSFLQMLSPYSLIQYSLKLKWLWHNRWKISSYVVFLHLNILVITLLITIPTAF